MKNYYLLLVTLIAVAVSISGMTARPVFAQSDNVQITSKMVSVSRGVKVCADFTLFPDNHKLPSNFELAGFIFQELGGSSSWFVNETGGRNGLQFSAKGVEITLPIPVSTVEFEIGAFAGDVPLSSLDDSGGVVRKQTFPAGTYRKARVSGADIATLVFTVSAR